MKGQTFEWLMTYGWAILIILIVAGVLVYSGIFAPQGFTSQSQNQTSIKNINLFDAMECNKINETAWDCQNYKCFTISNSNFCNFINDTIYTIKNPS
jgi:hypothetical protein